MNTSNLNSYIQGKSMDVVTLQKYAKMTIKTLKGCRDEVNFENIWLLTTKLSEKLINAIKDTNFEFKEPSSQRPRKVSRRLQSLAGEEGSEQIVPEAKDRYRIDTYYMSLDLVVAELESRFLENDLELLVNISNVILNPNPKKEAYEMVASHYNIDKDLLIVEHNLFFSLIEDSTDISLDSPGDVLHIMYENEQLEFLPHFAKAVKILNIIPVTLCSSERSFSALRRLKTYLRSTMEQKRLSDLAILCIEREYGNKVLKGDMDKIIVKFAEKNNRSKYFF